MSEIYFLYHQFVEYGVLNLNRVKVPEFGFKRYFPVRHVSKKKNGYDFFISNDESVIYKKNNLSNPHLLEQINTKEKLGNFTGIMEGNALPLELQNHISKGYDLEDNGSYKSEFLHGYRLDLLRTYVIDSMTFSMILSECDVLLEKIISANSSKKLTGDWALHNLVYSLKYKRIINVDLEGFLFYDPLPEWANIEIIQEWFNSITPRS